MQIFQLVEVDLEKARSDALQAGVYNKRQRQALLRLYDLFEQGEWQKCLDYVRSKAFPRNHKGEYPETEHIAVEVNRVLRDLGAYNFYTQAQIEAEVSYTLTRKQRKP